MNQPFIINYSNQTSTFPAYEEITGAVRIAPNSVRLAITGHARDLLTIKSGWYLLCDTGDETSELREITGINQAERKLIIATPFTVEPTDTNIRVVKVQSANTVCVYNSGADDLYVDGEVLAAGDKLLWTNMAGEPPIVLYGTGDYQVSNGDIYTPVVVEPVGQALTRVSDTNVTLTLGGSPTDALLKAVSITAGWSGTLAASRGGLGLDTSGSTGFPSVTAGAWSVLSAAAFRAAIGAGTGSGTVTSVSGTANRISSTGGSTPVIDIDAAYVGQTSITTLGTITTGVWSGTAIALNKIATVTASRALVSDGSGLISASTVTATELGYLSGVTSAIQTQLDAKTGYVGTPVNLTGQTAAIAATTAYTLPAQDGFYRVSMTLCITTAGGASSTIGFQFRFTNAADNTQKTTPNINDVTRTATNTTGAVSNYSFVCYAKASTALQYIVNYASSGTPAAYSFDLVVEKIK